VAAGYVLYGPSTLLVMTLGKGVDVFTLDTKIGEFVLTREQIKVPETTKEAQKTSALLLERYFSILPRRNPLYSHCGGRTQRWNKPANTPRIPAAM
jgi:hypothetical protein